MGDVPRLGGLEPDNGKRSQSQTFTRGIAQTGDDDADDDLASETSPVCVFAGGHLNGGNSNELSEKRSYLALDSFVIFDSEEYRKRQAFTSLT